MTLTSRERHKTFIASKFHIALFYPKKSIWLLIVLLMMAIMPVDAQIKQRINAIKNADPLTISHRLAYHY